MRSFLYLGSHVVSSFSVHYPVDNVNHSFGLIRVRICFCFPLILPSRSFVVVNVVLQMSGLNQAFQMCLESLAAFSLVTVLLMIGTEQVLISCRRISLHELGPLEVRLGFDLVKELVDRFLEDRVHGLVGS